MDLQIHGGRVARRDRPEDVRGASSVGGFAYSAGSTVSPGRATPASGSYVVALRRHANA